MQLALRAESSDDPVELLWSAADHFATAGLPLERIWLEGRILRHTPGSPPDPAVLADAARLSLRPLLARLRTAEGSAASDLTARQNDVLRGLGAGLTSKEIADCLGLSTRIVAMHVARLMQRLDYRTRSEAVRVATRRGWV